jgi:hypothetical protein
MTDADAEMAQLLAEQAEFDAYNGRPAARVVRLSSATARDRVEPPVVLADQRQPTSVVKTTKKKPSLFAQRMKLNVSTESATTTDDDRTVRETVTERVVKTTVVARNFVSGSSFPVAERVEFESTDAAPMPGRRRQEKPTLEPLKIG